MSSECYGRIEGRVHSFDLFHHDSLPSCCRAFALRELLEGRKERIDNLGYTQRLDLALTLSFGILHLYRTPWISQAVTLDDIILLREGNNMGHETYYLDLPLVGKRIQQAFQGSDSSQSTPTHQHPSLQQQLSSENAKRPIDFTVLALGLLLTQVITGEYFEELSIEEGATLGSMIDKRTRALKMTGLVSQNGGRRYAAAVQWCLDNFLHAQNLDEEELAGEFYHGVIFKLESDKRYTRTSS